ncbi:hypothetical protein JST97_26660 [bacterium]|nr:hypothetical protein [bacterium]
MKTFAKIALLWLVTRILLFLMAGLAASHSPHYAGYTPSQWGPWVDAWNHGDVRFYLEIASRGYLPGYYSNCGWFPGFPLLLSLLNPSLPNAILLNNLILLPALVAVWAWLRLDLDQSAAWRALLLLLAFPSAYFLTAPLSESTFLLCSAGAFVAARQGRWALAGVLGGWASLTRLVGLALWPALLLEKPDRKGAAWLALIPAAQLALYLHLKHRTGDFWAYFHVQRRLEPYISGWAQLARYQPLEARHWLGLSFAALTLLLMAGNWKQLRKSERVYCLISVLAPLQHSLWLSQARLMLVLIPLFRAWPAKLFPWILLLFGLLQAFALYLFALNHPALIY